MIQTLKLVGLAFELNSSYNQRNRQKSEKTKEELLEDESNDIELSFSDILHYSFNYIGVLTGILPHFTPI